MPYKMVVTRAQKVHAVFCRYCPQCFYPSFEVCSGIAVNDTACVQHPAFANTQTSPKLFQAISKADHFTKKLAGMIRFCYVCYCYCTNVRKSGRTVGSKLKFGDLDTVPVLSRIQL